MVVGLVSDVPETSTWVMLASGFGLMGAAALLRRKRHDPIGIV
jgi:LPXTG-motif cell wall-anchored protein